MAISSTAIAITGLLVSTTGAGVQYHQGRKAAKDQREANRVSSNQQRIDQLMQRRNEARRNAIQRAQAVMSASNAGVGDSSALFGSVGAGDTIQAGDSGNFNQAGRTGALLTSLSNRVARRQTQISNWGAFGQLGSMLASNASVLGSSAGAGGVTPFQTFPDSSASGGLGDFNLNPNIGAIS